MPLQTGKTLGLAALTVMALLLIAALGTRGAGAEETAMMPSSDDGAPLGGPPLGRRLLLVHGAAFRKARRREKGRLRLYRRQGGKPDL